MSRDLAVLPSQPTALASAHNSALSSTPSAALASARINAQVPALTVINRPQHSKCPPAALSFRLCRLPGPKREPRTRSRSTPIPLPARLPPSVSREPPMRSRSALLPPRPCRLPIPERKPPMRSRSAQLLSRPCRLPIPERACRLPIPERACRLPISEREPPTRSRSVLLSPPPLPSAHPRARAANAVALGAASTPRPCRLPRARAANAVALCVTSLPYRRPAPGVSCQCGLARCLRCANAPTSTALIRPTSAAPMRTTRLCQRARPSLCPPVLDCANALAPGFATALALALCAAGPECIQALPAVALSKRPAPPPKDVPECARVPPPQTGTIAHALRPAATRHLPTPQLAMPSANVAKFSRWLKISSAALPRALSQAPAAAPDAARRGDLGRHLELVCPAPSPPARPTNRRISDVVLLARLTRSSTRARTTSSN
ncbi:hypothetical protein PUNSTDRAFT_139656 [Punctularia strigosozonata HHB-11173 SS5]|uniref:Uncharacterized protein n=1 Tax=Punctularia strigosozonata (strain HHB-11173) TaxID=741275 RepID=R7RZC3_PUNST|nr:uncharacterized protein PUNSTDRAFT_139656 [Punctularia strigosozonata HHB-11173 SS5]EIN03328.1 hypothetical protein PUNSTDRAFT_139656 [Punctularia strigosozonata HHB-11173 SS5]